MASSSRFATIYEAQLDELVENKEAKNTKRATLSASSVFEVYLQEKDEEEPKTKAEIFNALKLFYFEARKVL